MSAADVLHALDATTGPVEVMGNGRLADEVRALLGARLQAAGPRPVAVVEMTGAPEQLAAALKRVDDLGTVVVAGPEPSAPLPLDLYDELHVRGLVVVGVPADPRPAG